MAGSPSGTTRSLSPLPSEADAAFVEREVFDAEVGEFGDAESSGVEEFEDSAVAEIGCVGLRMIGRDGRALHHGVDFGFGERFGQDLPHGERLEVHGGVVADAFVEQQPAIESAQAGELAGGGAGFDAVFAKMLEKAGDVDLSGGCESGVFRFEILGELGQISFVGLASERPQPFFDAKIEEIFAEERGVAEHGLIIGHGIGAGTDGSAGESSWSWLGPGTRD